MTRRINVLAVLGLVAVAACVKEPVPTEPNNQTITSSTFTATTEPATKTALSGNDTEGYSILWQDGDRILIADHAGHAGQYATGSTGEKADFSFVSDTGTEAVTGPYRAWYPASLYNGGTPTLPATQHYTTGNIAESPMYASSDSKSLEFKNLCGIIRLNLKTDDSEVSVKSISLSAAQGMSGVYSLNGDAAVISSGTSGVTLDCGSGVALGSTAVPFHISVPAGTYTNLSIMVTTTEGICQTRTLKSDRSVVVSRSGITDLTLSFNDLKNNARNLSAFETANTYIVSSAGTYKFNATIKGNGGLDPLTGATATEINPADISGVTVLWELYKNYGRVIKYSGGYDISYSAGYVTFSTPDTYQHGAACVAIFKDGASGTAGVYDKEYDEILWSWLLWMRDDIGTMTHNGKTFMNSNLGACPTIGENYVRGFLYQWGRKDAFTACAGTDNNSVYYYTPRAENVFTEYPKEVKSMAYAIAYPTARIVCKTVAIHSWMPESEYSLRPWRDDVKTIYDPCPPGWRVPTKTEIDGITGLPATGLYDSRFNDNNLRHFGNSEKGYYWTSTISSDPDLPAYAWAFCNDGRNLNNWSQSEGYAIRPLRE